MSKIRYQERIANNPALVETMDRLGISEHSELIVSQSMLNDPRLFSIIHAVMRSPNGPTAEIGCNAGGTSILIATLKGERHWACDTFSGLVDCDHRDDVMNGNFPTRGIEKVVARLAPFKNISVVHGYFPESAPEEMRSARYAFAHLDVDTYRSMHQCFEFFSERMLPGGIIALDDVIGRGTRGAKMAWEEIQRLKGRWKVVAEHNPQVVVEFA